MSTERERLKAKIMAQVEALVDQALAQGETNLTLTQIEDVALAVRSGVGQELTQRLLEQQASSPAPALPTCPDCGQRMHPKGKKTRYLRTRSGDARMQRPYYYCAACRRGHFPPG